MSTKTANVTVNAFMKHEPKCMGNTVSTGDSLILFGKVIAKWLDGKLWITNAGYPTRTTHDRLNEIPGVKLYVKKEVSYLNGKLWNGEWTVIE